MAGRKTTQNGTGKYPVETYLHMLTLAGRSGKTIEGYRKVLKVFAKFIGVPLDELHRHLLVENLLKYSHHRSQKARSPYGTKVAIGIIAAYYKANKVPFDEIELKAINPKVSREGNDKPITLEMLQRMMDITDVHGKAMLTVMVSTGMRAGEACELLLSDVQGDTITIRPEIAKNRHGGKVYLTSEAREYLDQWLEEREEHIRVASSRMKGLIEAGVHPKPEHDNRLFGITYNSMQGWFSRLYDKVDGERGQYQARCTVHSLRKYHRTQAAKAMHPDLVTSLMRQTGYLDNVYVKKTDEEKRQEFHEGEAALFLTRADHRIQRSEIARLRSELTETKKALEEMQALKGELIGLVGEMSKSRRPDKYTVDAKTGKFARIGK